MSRTCQDIRREFVEFFAERGHTFVPSSSLLPAEDPTLLFTNAGMNQFKDIFLGRESREYSRAANSQKCIRAGGKHNDLEDVGHDTYHHTFFEMLGNWSFGDYFKKDAIAWAWQLLTEVWGLPKDRLHATVFEGDEADGLAADDEARQLWQEITDIDPAHIHLGNKKDNFWEMGDTGPCGPCSEIHIDLTPDKSGGPLVNAGDASVIEIWNLVFIQFNRGADGKLSPLPACHVDTGMGLERVGMVLQGKKSNYATDLFVPIIEKIETLTPHRYGASSGLADRFDVTGETDIADVACRVVADHARTLTFAIADGVLPSNEGRGYVIRRILRRAARYGRQYLGIEGPFLVKLVGTIVEMMGEAFGEIADRRKQVEAIILEEEESFGRTLDKGIAFWWGNAMYALMSAFDRQESKKPLKKRRVMTSVGVGWGKRDSDDSSVLHARPDETTMVVGSSRNDTELEFRLSEVNTALVDQLFDKPPCMSGESVFTLYATYGFPVDLTQLMAAEKGLGVDMAGFEEAMSRHREISAGGGGKFQADAVAGLPATDDSPKYAHKPIEAKVLGWVADGKYISEGDLSSDAEVALVLDRTNFYGEQGGQVGDAGTLRWDGGEFAVETTRLAGQCVLHAGSLVSGRLAAGQTVTAEVGTERLDTMRNHTATHLLNWALRSVLGDHVQQAGSVVAPDRLRFDFTHPQALTDEQIEAVERAANERVIANEPVSEKLMPLAEARKIGGVRAVFGEKYPDPVRVIAIGTETPELAGDESAIEFCGGTHLDRTGQIGLLKIVAEESVAKGVRRISAVTGLAAYETVRQMDRTLKAVQAMLRVPAEQLPDRVAAMAKEIKELRKRPAGGGGGDETAQLRTIETASGNVVIGRVDHADTKAIRTLCDNQRQKGAAAVFVGGTDGEKVTLVAMVDEAVAAEGKLLAGDWVKAAAEAVGGSGGGKPTMAQAGGKNPAALGEALDAAAAMAGERLR
jgi:alanyl-tRNA synthetase